MSKMPFKKPLSVIALALCLVALGALAPMEEPDAVWGAGDPRFPHVIEVLKLGSCKRYSSNAVDYVWGITKIPFIKKRRKFRYCTCIPMDVGDMLELNTYIENIGELMLSVPAGFFNGEIDWPFFKTSDPHLEKTQKKVWAKEWVQDAGARELRIQAKAMITSIDIDRSSVFADAFNQNSAPLSQLNKLMGEFPDAYTTITPMDKEEDRINANLRRHSMANILAAGKGSAHYDNVLSALTALYNELIKDDGEKDPKDKLYDDLMEEIQKNILAKLDKKKGWKSLDDLKLDLNKAMNSVIKKLGTNSRERMMLYQLFNALMDDVLENDWLNFYAVVDELKEEVLDSMVGAIWPERFRHTAYPVSLTKDTIASVLEDMASLLFIVAPEKGQTKMLQLATAMADQQAGLTELNEHAFMKFQDMRMWSEQSRKSKNMAIQKNMELIGREAATVQGNGKSHKIGF